MCNVTKTLKNITKIKKYQQLKIQQIELHDNSDCVQGFRLFYIPVFDKKLRQLKMNDSIQYDQTKFMKFVFQLISSFD